MKKMLFARVGVFDGVLVFYRGCSGGDDVIVAVQVDDYFTEWVRKGRRAWVAAAEAGADFAPYEVTSFGAGGAFLLARDAWEEIANLLGMEDLYELEGWESCEVGDEVELAEARADLWTTHFHKEGIRFSFRVRHEGGTRVTPQIDYEEVA